MQKYLCPTFRQTSCLLHAPPKVQVYSRNPGEYGKDNTLICHVSGFHPPDISIQLLKNGVEIPDAKQTDLAFEQGWQFHL
uniref:Beta-2-microglobulin n=1 Tax=Hucho hucho TaxID=62062 RepID=A0A4W5LQE5_9TELE